MHRTIIWRRKSMDAVFPVDMRAQVLQAMARGVPLATAMEERGLPDEVAYGRARWNEEFRHLLYSALMDGRDPALRHGCPWTYSQYGCRCPECQATQTGCTAARRWLEEITTRAR
ncbi:hypothetical protein ACIBK9_11645 [Nonomuraea sp. NPDC050227]|uniref:hypothetical protein n=1 Tax=Nonomuraea sp. NPDC050227 TaxID=3364360 RepID=UPI0037B96477